MIVASLGLTAGSALPGGHFGIQKTASEGADITEAANAIAALSHPPAPNGLRWGTGWVSYAFCGRRPSYAVLKGSCVNKQYLRIDRLLGNGRTAVSFEYFPPKNQESTDLLYQTVDELHALHPTYVSVTYGAGGSTRRNTIEIVKRIQNQHDTRTMAHLTCIGHTRAEIAAILDELWDGGIRNILALRGDPPADTVEPLVSEFVSAGELVGFIRSRHDFCIGVAGYPEGHPKCPDRRKVLDDLKWKVDQGASFIITQLFFDNQVFYRFRDEARAAGIKLPIVSGIMPILNVTQTKRFVSMCGASIPTALMDRMELVQTDPQAVLAIGVDHALSQCRDLLAHQVAGLHFYTLNRSKATSLICMDLEGAFSLGDEQI